MGDPTQKSKQVFQITATYCYPVLPLPVNVIEHVVIGKHFDISISKKLLESSNGVLYSKYVDLSAGTVPSGTFSASCDKVWGGREVAISCGCEIYGAAGSSGYSRNLGGKSGRKAFVFCTW